MKDITQKAWQHASGFYLTHQFPNNWESLSYSEILDFISDHITEDYEHWDNDSVFQAIKELKDTLQVFAISIMPNHKAYYETLANNPELKEQSND